MYNDWFEEPKKPKKPKKTENKQKPKPKPKPKEMKNYQPNYDKIDFEFLNQWISKRSRNFIQSLLPEGKEKGGEYLALNPRRNDEKLGSFKINMTTGAWADFATGDKGRDLISLYAYVKGVGNVEAAREISREWR